MVPTAQQEPAQIWQKEYIRLICTSPVRAHNLPEFVEFRAYAGLSGRFHPPLLGQLVDKIFGIGTNSESFDLADNPPTRPYCETVRVHSCDFARKRSLGYDKSPQLGYQHDAGGTLPGLVSAWKLLV